MSRRLAAFFAVVVVAVPMLVGCGGDEEAGAVEDTPKDTATSQPTGSRATNAATGTPGAAQATRSGAPSAAAGTPVKDLAPGNLTRKVKAITIPDGMANGRKLGKDEAKVKLQIYEDFRCSHCLEFTADFEQYLIDQYVKPGTVQIEFKYFPLSQSSLPMMVAAQCATEQGQFWAYGKKLFTVHAESTEGGAALAEAFSEQKLKAYAAELKLDAAKFATCFAADATLDPIALDYREAQTIGVSGTPSFVINGKLQANVPGNNATWKSVLDAAAR